MITISGSKLSEIEKIEKKNILYLNYGGTIDNFYSSINSCKFCNVFLKSNIHNLSLESYDAYIIALRIFNFDEKIVEELLEKIYSFNKPVIILYASNYMKDFSGISYLSSRFNITFEMKDATIIEDSYDGYLPERNHNGYALSMISNQAYCKSYIKNSKNCFILRMGNISIIHEPQLSYYDIKRERIMQLTTVLLNLLSIPKDEEKPDWIHEIKILEEREIENEIISINEKINILKSEKEKQIKKLELNNEYKKILYTSGDELVEIVKKMLIEMLNTEIIDIDVKKEDLSFNLENKKILVEIKGVNTSIKREYVSQIQRHIEDDAKENNIEDDEISDNYKGVLIVNPYAKIPIKERINREFYSRTVIGDIKHHNICTIDTITLLSLFQKFRDGNDINMKDIILNKNYNEVDFSIIKLD